MDSLKYSLVFLLKNRQPKNRESGRLQVDIFLEQYNNGKKEKEGRKTGEKKENQEVCGRFEET